MMESRNIVLERTLYKRAQKKMREYASIATSSNVSMNEHMIGEIAVLEWRLYQKYRNSDRPYYVSKREYELDLERIKALEKWLIEGVKGYIEAEEQVKEAKELLYLIAFSRIRQKDGNRVY